MESSTVDPITFEILSHRLYQIAKEMGTTLERVGGTVNTTQMHDYMASIYRANGEILASDESMGWHVACAGFAVKRILERFEGEEGIGAGDIFLINDPYLAAIHQSDVYMVSPVHYHATFGACFEVVLGTLGYDIPKNHGVMRPLEVIAPKGTVVNVEPPAPVSLNTTSGGQTVKYLVKSVLGQMLATSEKWQSEVMAHNVGQRLARHAGVNQHGRYYASSFALGAFAGGGARSHRDGTDSGHIQLSCPNVEWVELNFPLLHLFRRHTRDGSGAGKFRGGAGGETAVVAHDAPEGKVKVVAYGVAGLRNSGRGIFGGYPGAPSIIGLREGAEADRSIARGRYPGNLDHIGSKARRLAYCDFDLQRGDVLYMRQGNGGGSGDPYWEGRLNRC